MKILSTLALLMLCLHFKALCQASKLDYDSSIYKCSRQIEKLSYYWRIDSLANNGYRREVKDRLRYCIMDSVSENYILDKLGPPTELEEYTNGIKAYCYYYYDYRKIDSTKYNGPYGFDFITLDVDNKTKRLVKISEGTGDY